MVSRDTLLIYAIHYDISLSFPMPVLEILIYPLHQMVLEYALDDLM